MWSASSFCSFELQYVVLNFLELECLIFFLIGCLVFFFENNHLYMYVLLSFSMSINFFKILLISNWFLIKNFTSYLWYFNYIISFLVELAFMICIFKKLEFYVEYYQMSYQILLLFYLFSEFSNSDVYFSFIAFTVFLISFSSFWLFS
jgi:hypothetical protein